jgi:hypothetical protein
MTKNGTEIVLSKISINFQAKDFGEISVPVVVVLFLVLLVMVNIVRLRMFIIL